MQLTQLLKSGLLRPGQLLTCHDFHRNCTVTETGGLDLDGWPVPLRSIKEATWRAEVLAQYGHGVEPRNLRTPNPLYFWSYFDQFTNRDEKLARLWQLNNSSYAEPSTYCELCSDAVSQETDNIPQGDAGLFLIPRPFTKVIAPRRHFTNFERFPSRDAKALDNLVAQEVLKKLKFAMEITVSRRTNDAGHVYYSME